jgi:hypothetical protein
MALLSITNGRNGHLLYSAVLYHQVANVAAV